ncbi:UNVERIFIED_CONTAM: putative mitochondrial protein [Sesamum latifolium]|uniref:Mitochondrial protein n=1 Tax=Sesamum latifolium TaxID=2727402 RepID=A0AAW2TPV0_9LAMI
MSCVTSISYLFLLNGFEFGSLSPTRGLRQGDPLSPYLFLLCTEAFNALIHNAERQGHIKGISICKQALSISHLLFADDTQIYCQATPQSILCICEVLDTYAKVLGPRVNFHKSSMVLSSNTDALLKRNRVWQRIQGWNERNLSQAGKMIMIKSVIQSIPTYALSVFRLPDSLLNEIQSLISSFFWDNKDKRKIHWINWHQLCKSREDGGLGFRQLKAFNSALLAKQLWRLVTNTSSLISQVMKARYYPTSSPLEAKLGSRPSLTWRSILSTREIIQPALLPNSSANGASTVKSAYFLALKLHNPASSSQSPNSELPRIWKIIWKANVPPKVRLFAWKLANKALPSGTTLENRMKILQPPCSFCGASSENFAHVFVQCHIARQAWALSNLPWDIISRWKDDPLHWFRDVGNHLQPMDFDFFLVMCWFLWWSRNQHCMKNKFINPMQTVTSARCFLEAYQEANLRSPTSATTPSDQTWHRPPNGFIKINFDGALFQNHAEVGVGVVARDCQGGIRAWFSHRFPRHAEPELAEALAARTDIDIILKHRWPSVILEGDCLPLINKLRSSATDNSLVRPLIWDIKSASSACHSFLFNYVSRNGNSLAHKLARLASARSEGHDSFSAADVQRFKLLDFDLG